MQHIKKQKSKSKGEVQLKSKNQKLQAFTLSEMIVVLLITVIVVGLAFSVLQLVQKQMSGMGENYQFNTELNLLQQALWIDFETYPYITYDGTTNVMRCQNEEGIIDYLFEEKWIIRKKDTFNLTLERKLFYFDGRESTGGEVDALELLTTKEKGAKIIFVHQENAANEYLN